MATAKVGKLEIIVRNFSTFDKLNLGNIVEDIIQLKIVLMEMTSLYFDYLILESKILAELSDSVKLLVTGFYFYFF